MLAILAFIFSTRQKAFCFFMQYTVTLFNIYMALEIYKSPRPFMVWSNFSTD